jgi:hypothetical protein
MGRLARCTVPTRLGADVGLRSTTQAALTTGETRMLAAIQPTAGRGAAVLTVGGHAMRVLRAVLADAAAADRAAGVVARALARVLAGTRTAARLIAAW